jgi:hypothetical protein
MYFSDTSLGCVQHSGNLHFDRVFHSVPLPDNGIHQPHKLNRLRAIQHSAMLSPELAA